MAPIACGSSDHAAHVGAARSTPRRRENLRGCTTLVGRALARRLPVGGRGSTDRPRRRSSPHPAWLSDADRHYPVANATAGGSSRNGVSRSTRSAAAFASCPPRSAHGSTPTITAPMPPDTLRLFDPRPVPNRDTTPTVSTRDTTARVSTRDRTRRRPAARRGRSRHTGSHRSPATRRRSRSRLGRRAQLAGDRERDGAPRRGDRSDARRPHQAQGRGGHAAAAIIHEYE